ncbi:MAG TPA: hypothetical protein VMJ10_23070 [Kofleriaceae bacterium]|nr:hypothetical protein [Kofleriaceae bacterium]
MRWIFVAIFIVAVSAVAEARSEKTLAYPRDEAWPAAVRFIRLDAHFKVIEKDPDAGYVVFELVDDKKTFRGSLEVIDVVQDDQHQVRFVMTIEDRPSWFEVELLAKLERKLRAELGSPAPPPTPKKKPDEPAKKDEPKKDEPKPPSVTDDPPPVSPNP